MHINSRFKRWRQSRRYRETVRQLRALPPQELKALGIPPAEINRLACAASCF